MCPSITQSWPEVKIISPVMSFRSFIVVLLICKFTIHFGLIFVKCTRSSKVTFFLHVDVQSFWHYLLKKMLCLLCDTSSFFFLLLLLKIS